MPRKPDASGALAWLATIALVLVLIVGGLILIGFLPILVVAMPITTLVILVIVIWALARRK